MADSLMSKALDGLGTKKGKLWMTVHPLDDGNLHVKQETRGGSELSPDDSQEFSHNVDSLKKHIEKYYGKKSSDTKESMPAEIKKDPVGMAVPGAPTEQ